MSFMPTWCRLILLPPIRAGISSSRATISVPGSPRCADRIEQQDVRRVEQQRHQRQALRAAVDDLDVRRHVPALAERLDAADAEALVGPEQVADAEHHDAALRRQGFFVHCSFPPPAARLDYF